MKQSVRSFRNGLIRDYDLVSADLIYRYDPLKDFIHIHHGILDGLVWGKNSPSDKKKIKFGSGRVWYIVTDTNKKLNYLFSKKASWEIVATNLAIAKKYIERLKEAIYYYYSDKSYMELVRFVGWTAYSERRKSPIIHKKIKGLFSKEKGYSLDAKKTKRGYVWKGSVSRQITSAEILEAFNRRYRRGKKKFKNYQDYLKWVNSSGSKHHKSLIKSAIWDYIKSQDSKKVKRGISWRSKKKSSLKSGRQRKTLKKLRKKQG